MVDAVLAAARALVDSVVAENREWMESNRGGSLGDLRDRIDLALAQCLPYVLAGDAPIADRAGLPEPLAEELSLWPIASDFNTAPQRFSDAGAFLAGAGWRVSVLERLVGRDCKIGRLLDLPDA